jgi:hypothetical protein
VNLLRSFFETTVRGGKSGSCFSLARLLPLRKQTTLSTGRLEPRICPASSHVMGPNSEMAPGLNDVLVDTDNTLKVPRTEAWPIGDTGRNGPNGSGADWTGYTCNDRRRFHWKVRHVRGHSSVISASSSTLSSLSRKSTLDTPQLQPLQYPSCQHPPSLHQQTCIGGPLPFQDCAGKAMRARRPDAATTEAISRPNFTCSPRGHLLVVHDAWPGSFETTASPPST